MIATNDRTHVRVVEPRLKDGARGDLRRYKETRDECARERLILAYAPLVKSIAGRMASWMPRHVEECDLVSSGLVGLIGAIERFDPARGVKFETFAVPRIRGAIVDNSRSLDWVPRSVRSKAREIQKVNADLENRLYRAPSHAETAATLGVSVDELKTRLVDISNSSIVALDERCISSDARGGEPLLDSIHDARAPDPVAKLATEELRDQLAETVAVLPERERLVIGLYYYENLILSEISEVLGVSESRVLQLRTKAVLRLQSALGDDGILQVECG